STIHRALRIQCPTSEAPSTVKGEVTNKMDEIRVRCMPHCVTIITETWLNHNIPDAAIELAGCSVYRTDRTKDSGKNRGGGLCIYVNNGWCTASEIIDKHCCPNLEVLT
ncbi:hypothetical protein KUCAC02_015747, partial [Chaenocephalus aceratus]